MNTRVLLTLAGGKVPADVWRQVIVEEPARTRRPKACGDCPLRPGGAWREGALAVKGQVQGMARLGCHTDWERPCYWAGKLAAP